VPRRFAALLAAVDSYQRRHAWLGFPLAVRKKFSDDQGGTIAAAVTYYGFFSIFPLLLVFVSVLGFVLRGHPGLERSIVNSALGQLPIVGGQLHAHSLKGSTVGVAVGIAASLWAGMNVFTAVERGMSRFWDVPREHRAGFVGSRLRALLVVLVIGTGVVGATALGGVGTAGGHLGVAWKLAAVVLSTVMDVGLFWAGFRLLTSGVVTWRSLRGGAVVAAVAYEVLQLLGGLYVGHVLKNASNTYGTFALVIGLLSWIYLTVQATLLAAEVNVVATKRLWPRDLS
jgi:YihY family inner membrane protein